LLVIKIFTVRFCDLARLKPLRTGSPAFSKALSHTNRAALLRQVVPLPITIIINSITVLFSRDTSLFRESDATSAKAAVVS